MLAITNNAKITATTEDTAITVLASAKATNSLENSANLEYVRMNAATMEDALKREIVNVLKVGRE